MTYEAGGMAAMMKDDPLAPFTTLPSRLYSVRYVFLVHIEDGIPQPIQRAALEYIDTIVREWPRCDGSDDLPEGMEVVTPDDAKRLSHAAELFDKSEKYLGKFVRAEHQDDVENMVTCLVAIGDCAAEIRGIYQPGYNLPTFAEVRRLVQDEWDEGIGALMNAPAAPENGDGAAPGEQSGQDR